MKAEAAALLDEELRSTKVTQSVTLEFLMMSLCGFRQDVH
jgi:hypothetical protein